MRTPQAEAKRPKVLELLPPERVLTETDYPHSRRSDPRANRPAAVDTIETALEHSWGLDRSGVRRRVWRNLGELFDRTGCTERLPAQLRRTLLMVSS